jgi:hypothetical protein
MTLGRPPREPSRREVDARVRDAPAHLENHLADQHARASSGGPPRSIARRPGSLLGITGRSPCSSVRCGDSSGVCASAATARTGGVRFDRRDPRPASMGHPDVGSRTTPLGFSNDSPRLALVTGTPRADRRAHGPGARAREADAAAAQRRRGRRGGEGLSTGRRASGRRRAIDSRSRRSDRPALHPPRVKPPERARGSPRVRGPDASRTRGPG